MIYEKMVGVATIEIEGIANKQFCDKVTIELWDTEYDGAVKRLKERGVIE